MQKTNDLTGDFLKDMGFIFDNPEKEVKKYPLTDIATDSNDNLIINIAIAGFSKNDIDIELEGNLLIISGSKEKIVEDLEYHQKYISSKDFSRNIELSKEYSDSEIDAEIKDGILKIKIPKAEKPKKLIEIRG